MKIIKVFVITLILFSFGFCTSCKRSDNPVDQYVELIDKATKKLEKLNNPYDIQDIQNIITDEKGQNLEKEYADYELTAKDKEKLKASIEKLINVVADKTMEHVGFTEDLNQLKNTQIELMVNEVNSRIDSAKTLGDIEGF